MINRYHNFTLTTFFTNPNLYRTVFVDDSNVDAHILKKNYFIHNSAKDQLTVLP